MERTEPKTLREAQKQLEDEHNREISLEEIKEQLARLKSLAKQVGRFDDRTKAK